MAGTQLAAVKMTRKLDRRKLVDLADPPTESDLVPAHSTQPEFPGSLQDCTDRGDVTVARANLASVGTNRTGCLEASRAISPPFVDRE